MLNIGFIGCGNMGSIIAMAVNKSQKECKFFLSDLNHQNANSLSCETGGKVCDNIEIAKKLRMLLETERVGTVLDTCHAMMTKHIMQTERRIVRQFQPLFERRKTDRSTRYSNDNGKAVERL